MVLLNLPRPPSHFPCHTPSPSTRTLPYPTTHPSPTPTPLLWRGGGTQQLMTPPYALLLMSLCLCPPLCLVWCVVQTGHFPTPTPLPSHRVSGVPLFVVHVCAPCEERERERQGLIAAAAFTTYDRTYFRTLGGLGGCLCFVVAACLCCLLLACFVCLWAFFFFLCLYVCCVFLCRQGRGGGWFAFGHETFCFDFLDLGSCNVTIAPTTTTTLTYSSFPHNTSLAVEHFCAFPTCRQFFYHPLPCPHPTHAW